MTLSIASNSQFSGIPDEIRKECGGGKQLFFVLFSVYLMKKKSTHVLACAMVCAWIHFQYQGCNWRGEVNEGVDPVSSCIRVGTADRCVAGVRRSCIASWRTRGL